MDVYLRTRSTLFRLRGVGELEREFVRAGLQYASSSVFVQLTELKESGRYQ